MNLDRVFHALADPTRRTVVEQLGRGPAATSALAQDAGMALPSFLQHLDVLQTCGLVRSSKSGRIRTYELSTERLDDVEGWLAEQRLVWNQRLDRLDAFLTQGPEQP